MSARRRWRSGRLPALLLGGMLATASAMAVERVAMQPVDKPALTDVPRIGLNLGGWSTWGAEQLMQNVLKNPGFEPLIDRSLVIVGRVLGDRVVDDSDWLGRPDGFWDGGRYEIRSGAAAGRSGRIAAYRRGSAGGAGAFTLEPFPPSLQPGDAIAVSVEHVGQGIPLWWSGTREPLAAAPETRPGSPGRQSARLVAAPGQRSSLNHHLDMLAARAGKLLPVEGPWQLVFWARGKRGGERLRVSLRRGGGAAFLDRQIPLSARWQRFEFPFTARDDGPAGPLSLGFELESGEALVDDAVLGETREAAGGFRSSVVSLLASLRPGYLRDWQGQLGDSFANRTASAHGRQPVRYRPGDDEQMFFYGLPEFLALCEAVGAQPWVIAPPLQNDADWRAFGAFLGRAAARHGFREVLVEFGNENWNMLFRPAGFTDPATHARAAERAFALIAEGAGSFGRIITVLNAQFVNPASWGALARASPRAQRIAVAPYFLYSLDESPPETAVAAAFGDNDATLRGGIAQTTAQGRRVSVYEVNFHTTGGTAGKRLRDMAVTGSHSAAALARRLLQATLSGVREQAVYSLAGFDSHTDSGDRTLVRLWGVARDLASPTLRPTGLAVALLNQVMEGDAHGSTCAGSTWACQKLTAAWFISKRGRQFVVASAAAAPIVIQTSLPCSPAYSLQLVDGSDRSASNEKDDLGAPPVRIATAEPGCSGGLTFEIPPYSIAIVREAGRP